MTTATAVRVAFELEKETKNTRKFTEVPEPGQAPAIGALYVQKHVLHGLGNPENITVTIEG